MFFESDMLEEECKFFLGLVNYVFGFLGLFEQDDGENWVYFMCGMIGVNSC